MTSLSINTAMLEPMLRQPLEHSPRVRAEIAGQGCHGAAPATSMFFKFVELRHNAQVHAGAPPVLQFCNASLEREDSFSRRLRSNHYSTTATPPDCREHCACRAIVLLLGVGESHAASPLMGT